MGGYASFLAMDKEAQEILAGVPPDENILPCQKEKVFLRIALKDEYGEPYANRPYVLKVGDEEWNTKTTDEGMVEQALPNDATKGELRFWPEGDPKNEEPDIYTLDLGKMDPIGLETGRDERLSNLSFFAQDDDGRETFSRDAAIFNFRLWAGLEDGPELDEKAVAMLRSYYDPYGREAAFDPFEDPKEDSEGSEGDEDENPEGDSEER
jgi:hypothetical protein